MADRDSARPTYAGAFRCIGPECEDTCCRGWEIPVDRTTYEKYKLFPADRLGWAVTGFVSVTSAEVPDPLYAHIHMDAAGDCPFFEADRLCGIQKAYGAALLSSTCSSYPRAFNWVDGGLEGSLSLSCPEAARNVLLDPDFLGRTADLAAGGFRTDNFFRLGTGSGPGRKPYEAFLAIRAAMIGLARDRTRPVWLRILRMGALCQRLEAAEAAGSAIATVQAGVDDRMLLQLKRDRKVRLEISMQWTDERVRDESAGRRFGETFWAFTEGIGSAMGGQVSDDLGKLAWAEEAYYRPFLKDRPHLLENYLVNSIYQRLFPFGRAGGVALRERGMFEEFVLMASQFGWLEMLMMGIAANDKEDFGEAQVVRTVQTFHRAVEHYSGVLEGVLATMRERGLHNLAGLAVMLK